MEGVGSGLLLFGDVHCFRCPTAIGIACSTRMIDDGDDDDDDDASSGVQEW